MLSLPVCGPQWSCLVLRQSGIAHQWRGVRYHWSSAHRAGHTSMCRCSYHEMQQWPVGDLQYMPPEEEKYHISKLKLKIMMPKSTRSILAVYINPLLIFAKTTERTHDHKHYHRVKSKQSPHNIHLCVVDGTYNNDSILSISYLKRVMIGFLSPFFTDCTAHS